MLCVCCVTRIRNRLGALCSKLSTCLMRCPLGMSQFDGSLFSLLVSLVTWPQSKVSADGGSNDYLRVRAESVSTCVFFSPKMFWASAKNENESVAGALRGRGCLKNNILKFFCIRDPRTCKID